eukprot:403356312
MTASISFRVMPYIYSVSSLSFNYILNMITSSHSQLRECKLQLTSLVLPLIPTQNYTIQVLISKAKR